MKPRQTHLRLWPKSLVGQLVLATVLALAVGQMINFALLVSSREQNRIAMLAGPAATRIADAMDRAALGLPQPVPPPRRGGPPRPRAIVESGAALVTPAYRRWPELEQRIAEALAQNGYAVRQLRAGTGRLERLAAWEAQTAPPRFRERQWLIVSAEIAPGRWINLRVRTRRDDPQVTLFLIVQTLLLYALMLGPIAWIGWRAAQPLRALTRAATAPLPADGGQPLAPAGPADVQELTIAFNAMRARLARMLSEKDHMLGAIGHDLRTPLASLKVRAEQVSDPALGAKMSATVDEMAHILNDILDLAHIGQSREPREPTDLAALIEAVIEDYAAAAPADTPAVRLAAPVPRLIAPVRGLLLRRALRNLIDNALAHGGGTAELALSRDDMAAHISVRDRGTGIAADRLAEMLQPFTRAEGSRNRATGGAGLGLALVKAIAEGEGGSLTLHNREGSGLEARIALPLAHAAMI